jgi:hypothetical protein
MNTTWTEVAPEFAGYTVVAPGSVDAKVNATGNVIDFYYTPNTDIEYIVYYYLEGTTTNITADKLMYGQTMNSTVTEYAKTITGYLVVGPDSLTYRLNATGNVFVFYYKSNIEYVVHYYLQGTTLEVAPDKTVSGQLLGALVKEFAISIPDYTLVSAPTIDLLLKESGNEAFFYYVETDKPVLFYTLTYHSDELTSGTVPLSESYPYGNSAVIADQGDMVMDGFAFLGWDTEPTANIVVYRAGDSLAIFGHVDLYAVWEPVDLTTSYVVHYYLVGTTQKVREDKIAPGLIGSSVTETAVGIVGYSAMTPFTVTITLTETNNEFIFYYTPNIEYTVHYYINGTTTQVTGDKKVPGQTLDASITENAITIDGYTAIAPTSLTATLNETDNEFVFYYTKNVDYTVYYYLQGTSTPVATTKVVPNRVLGSSVTETAIPITGYTAVTPTSITANLNATNNVFRFYYTANPGPTETPGSGGGGSGGSTGGTSKTPTPKPEATATPTPPPKHDDDTRLTPEEPLKWALVNLVIGIVGLIIAIVLVVMVLLLPIIRKQKQEKKTQSDAEKKIQQRNTLVFLAAVILGIVGIIVFFLTEDMSRVMGSVDKWTIVNAIIFIVEIIAMIFTFKFKKESDTKNTTNSKNNKN